MVYSALFDTLELCSTTLIQKKTISFIDLYNKKMEVSLKENKEMNGKIGNNPNRKNLQLKKQNEL